ncbi:hypothetical protein PILCRDRAFT_822726 [Piloderma croceum F 1598]|uniref:Bacteriophage T5 Orf172 DNA-binding domain-containing protein n=1 Tax=Piloderma croceum (strain F 1598) TaxID=765440 RepID=A0A0C3BSB5_PILCF|nr:hypothetical protein PILCRDRAFT_822726 [Piloderma croceum F 1598]
MPSSNLISVVCPHCQHHHYCVREDTYNDTDRVVQKATVTQSRRPSPKPPVPLRQTEVVYPRYSIAPQTSPSSGYYAPNHKWVEYDLYIPGYLQPATRVAIMNKMQERPSVSDRSGYIYAFAIEGVKSPQRFQIKVGRESKVGQRLGSYWSKHYRDFSPRLIFPTEKMKSIGVPAYKKVERLALLVMADLAQHKAYLDPDSMKAGIRKRWFA